MPTYEVDEIAAQHGHEVLRLPPYHCDLNPIELVWAQVKSHVARNNTNFTVASLEPLIRACLDVVTPPRWADVCRHTDGIMEEYIAKEPHLEAAIESCHQCR